jgi:hypothetical protein
MCFWLFLFIYFYIFIPLFITIVGLNSRRCYGSLLTVLWLVVLISLYYCTSTPSRFFHYFICFLFILLVVLDPCISFTV